jgi:hypothetical protein
MVLLGLSCVNFASRPDNQIAVAVSVLAGLAIVWASSRGGKQLARVLVLIPSGIIAGLYFQPSSAMLLSISVAVLSLAGLVKVRGAVSKIVGVLTFAAGATAGYALMFGLMTLISPSQLRC